MSSIPRLIKAIFNDGQALFPAAVDELGMKRCDTSAIFFDCRVIYEGGRETWHFDTISKSSNVQLMGMISFQTPLLSNELYKISALYKKWYEQEASSMVLLLIRTNMSTTRQTSKGSCYVTCQRTSDSTWFLSTGSCRFYAQTPFKLKIIML